MTYKEKLSKTHSEEGVKDIVKKYCPSDYFETASNLKECDLNGGEICEKCWNQQIPQEEQNAADETISAYEAGLSDAWTLLKRFQNSSETMRTECFGVDCMSDLLENFTPKQALEKVEQYEKETIHVGDIVEFPVDGEEMRGVVTLVNGISCTGIHSDGCFITPSSECKKTGKHYDLDPIFELIKETEKKSNGKN